MTEGNAANSRLGGIVTWFKIPGAWWSPRHWRFWALVLLIVYTLSGFLLAPWIAKRQIVSGLSEALERPVELEKLRINPYVLSVEATGFKISETDGEPLIGFDRLFINFQLSSLFRWAWTFREIKLESPSAEMIRYAVGDTNFSRLPSGDPEPEEAPAPDEGGMPRLLIHELALTHGIVDVVDHVPETHFEETFGPIDITVFELSTIPDASGQQQVAIQTAHGTKLEWSGSVSVNPFHSSGQLSASGPYVPLIYRYFRDQVTIDVPAGNIELGFDYEIAAQEDGSFAAAIDRLSMAVRELAVNNGESGSEILSLPEISLTGGQVRWPAQSFSADRLAIVSPKISLWREPDGVLSVEGLVVDSPPVESEAVANDAGTDDSSAEWSIGLESFEIIDLAVQFEDRALRETGVIEITDLDLNIGQISNEPEARFPLRLAVETAPGGQTVVEGGLTALPVAAFEGTFSIDDLQLAILQPYVSDKTTARIDGGSIELSSDFSVGEQTPLMASGRFSLSSLSISDSVSEERLLGWDDMAIDRFEFDGAGNSVAVSELGFAAPYVRLLINEDQSTNFKQLVIEQEAAQTEDPQAEPAPPPANGQPMQVTIGRVGIEGGSADFTDLALPLPFAAKIANLNGEITTLATASSEPANVQIEGQVDEYGLARIQGSLMATGPIEKTDLTVLFRNVKMHDLSPYTIKFAGREIADGSIDLDLHYKIEQGIMAGENKIVIADLELGEKVDYPGATSLPLGLAVALLKGPDGKIDVDLPVAGDVNDPEFKIGGVVVKALFGLITGIVTSPFRLLGKLVGIGSSDDFDLVQFEPGLAELTPPEREKIAKLAEALNQRPGLALKVPQTVNIEVDRAALQVIRVDDQIDQQLAAQEGDGEVTELLTERRREVIETLYETQFPELPLDAVDAEHMQPENPAEPEGKMVLDETAYVAGLRQRLIDATEVTESELADLARARGQSVIASLTAEGGIGADRVELEPPADGKTNDAGWVLMKLEVDTASAE